MVIGLDISSGKWRVQSFNNEHNSHPLTSSSKITKQFSHQTLHRTLVGKKFINNLDSKRVCPSTICKVLNVVYGSEENFVTPPQCQSILRAKWKNIGME